MKRSVWNPYRFIDRRAISPALGYREWLTNRSLYVTAGLLLVAPWMWLVWRTDTTHTSRFFTPQSEMRDTIHSYVHNNYHVLYFALIAGLLGMGIMWHDRVRGRLSYALEGPVPRCDALQVKMFYGFLTIAAANAVNATVMLVGAALIGVQGVAGGILWASLWAILLRWTVFMTALAMSTLIGNAAYIAIASTLITAFPWMVSKFATHWYGYYGLPTPRIAGLIAQLSPLTVPFHLLLPPTVPQVLLGTWFILWGAAWAFLARVFWDRVPFERFTEPVFFPVLWNGVYAIYASFSALMVGLPLVPNAHPDLSFLNLLHPRMVRMARNHLAHRAQIEPMTPFGNISCMNGEF